LYRWTGRCSVASPEKQATGKSRPDSRSKGQKWELSALIIASRPYAPEVTGMVAVTLIGRRTKDPP